MLLQPALSHSVGAVSFVLKSHSFFVVQLQAACSTQETRRRPAAGRRRTVTSDHSSIDRLDNHWASQELRYDWEAELSGIGSRSRVEFWVIWVLPLYLLNNDMVIEAASPSHPLCYVIMLCGLFCFVCSNLNISSIVWSIGKTSASTATKHYHSRTVFRETSHLGKWPSGKHLSRKVTIRERLSGEKNPSGKVTILETTVYRSSRCVCVCYATFSLKMRPCITVAELMDF